MKQVWRVSTHGKLHLIQRGYYACNEALGSMPGENVTEHKQFSSIKCKNCLRKCK